MPDIETLLISSEIIITFYKNDLILFQKNDNQWNSSSCYSYHAKGERSLVLTSVSLATLLTFEIAWDLNMMKDNYPKGSKSIPWKVMRVCFHSYGRTEVHLALNTSGVVTLSSLIKWLLC